MMLGLWLVLPGLLAAQDFTKFADELLSAPPFQGATVGAVFAPVERGAASYVRNPDLPLEPASTAKLATSAAALDRLGPEFRFTTSFLIKKRDQARSRLSALVWRGTGDPSISGRGRASITEVFDIWADSLTARGVRKARRLVLDGRYFEGPAVVEAWPQEEASYWYQAESSAISFNDNCVSLEFRPAARVGRRPKIGLIPDFGYIKVKNRARTVPAGGAFTLDYRREPQGNEVRFFGDVPAGPARRDFVAVHDPARFAAETLQRVWQSKGIEVGKITAWEDSDLREGELVPLFSWKSQPLAELVKIVNKNSQNLYAEQMLKTLGKEISGRGSFSSGLVVVDRFLTQAGLSEAQFHLIDGSGLSEQDRFTAAGLAKLLGYMAHTPLFATYYESLAVPGVDRNAMDRMKGDPLASGMRLKHGTVAHARNLAGYLHSQSGKLYAFAVLVNGPKLDRRGVDAAFDRLCLAAAHQLP